MSISFHSIKMMKVALAMVCGVFVLSGLIFPFASETRAANGGINRQINYQAKLFDNSGTAVTDGNYSVKFSLYDAAVGGNRVWTATGTTAVPTALTLSVSNGLFTILLGDSSAAGGYQNVLDSSVNWNNDGLYLGITIGADAEMTPRKRLSAAPQAFNAENLQGMYASSSAYGGQSLFALHQTLNNAATGTRTTLEIRSEGTSDANDFLLRGINDLGATVLSVNRQGNVTSSGYFALTGSGTSTITGNLSVAGNSVLGDAALDVVTVNGRFGTDLLPLLDVVYSLGSSSNRWNAYLGNVTSTSATSTDFFSANGRFTNLATTNLTPTNLSWTYATGSLLSLTSGTSTNFGVTGSVNVTGVSNFSASTTISTSTIGALYVTSTIALPANAIIDAFVTDALTISGGTINNTPIGFTTPSTAIFTSATATSVTTTDLFATNARFTNLNLSSFNPTNLSWTYATGTLLSLTSGTSTNFGVTGSLNINGVSNFSASTTISTSTIGALYVTSTITLPANAITDAFVTDALTISGGTINNTPIGASTPSTAVFTNATATNLTTSGLSNFSAGYIAAASSTILGAFTVTGPTALQTLTFTQATATSVTSTDFFSTNARFSNLNLTNLNWTNASGTSAAIFGSLSNIATTGTVMRVVTTTSVGSSPVSLVLNGKMLYTLNSGSSDASILDVTNPNSPVSSTAQTIGASCEKFVLQGNYVYSSCSGSGSLLVHEIRSPISLKSVGSLTGLTGPTDVVVNGRYAYVTTGAGDNKLVIVNISDPTRPRTIASVSTGLTAYAAKVVVKGNYAYLIRSSGVAGAAFSIIDISNPYQPSQRGTITDTNGLNALVVQGGYAYYFGGGVLNVVNVTNPDSPTVVGTIGSTVALNLAISGRYLYGTGNGFSHTLTVIDVASSTNPTPVQTLTLGGGPGDVLVAGRYVYVADSTSSTVSIIDTQGIETTSLIAHAAEIGKLEVRGDGTIGGRLSIAGGLSVGRGGIQSEGSLSVSATNTTSTILGNLSVGTSTREIAMFSAFTMSGSDLLVGGNIGSVSSVYTNGDFVVGTAGMRYGDGFITKTDGDITIKTGNGTIYVSGTTRLTGNLLANISPVSSTVVQTLSTVTSSAAGAVGQYLSAVIGGDGFPIMAFYDSVTGDLKLIHCTTVSCSASDPTVVVDGSTNDVGQYTSMVLGTDGFPIISYYDVSNGDLKVAHCKNTGCTSSDVFTVDSSNNVGVYSSIAIGSNGYPVIAYQNVGGIDSYFIACRSIDCSLVAQKQVINSIGDSGYFSHVVVPSDGRPTIAYYEDGGGDLVIAKCDDATCTHAVVTTADSTGTVGKYLSMTISRLGLPIVSYFDTTNNRIKVISCLTLECATFSSSEPVIDFGAAAFDAGVGPWTSIMIGSDGMPDISYIKPIGVGDTDPAVIHCNNTSCNATSTALVFDSSTANYDKGTVMLRGQDGVPVALYHRTSTPGAIRAGRACLSDGCALGGGLVGSSIGSPTNYFYRMYSRELYAQQAYLSGFDLAEAYPTDDATLQPGDVVAFDETQAGKVVKADSIKHATVIGAVSTKPGLLLSEWANKPGVNTTAVALAGRVPVAVSVENGSIAIGDLLTLSRSKPGVAVKAIGPGMTLGRALAATKTDGLIEVFMQVGYDAGSVLASDGSIAKVTSDVVMAPQTEVSAVTTTASSWGLTFRGAAWDGKQAVTSDYVLANEVLNADISLFSIRDASATRLFALDQTGGAAFRSDVVVGGKLYPSARGTAQTSTYIFVDNTQGTSTTYVSTNAAGWQSDDSYDFAERYYSPDQLAPGDLVVVSERGRLHVQRSMDVHQMLAGIVSTKPGFVAGKPASSTYPIALMGRVPTKVSSMNGAIKAGDMIAPSAIPGLGVKATTAGPVVGQALESFDGADSGLIEVFVNPVWWGGLSEPAVTPVASTPAPAETVPSTASSYQGFALVAAGATKVHVSFPTLGSYPSVQATPRGQVDGGWWTDGYLDTGFDVILKQPQTHDVVFTWRADKTAQGTQMYLSDGTTAKIDPMTGVIIQTDVAPTSTPAVMPEAATTTVSEQDQVSTETSTVPVSESASSTPVVPAEPSAEVTAP